MGAVHRTCWGRRTINGPVFDGRPLAAEPTRVIERTFAETAPSRGKPDPDPPAAVRTAEDLARRTIAEQRLHQEPQA